MTLADLRERLERRAREAERVNATAPVAAVVRDILSELADVSVSTISGCRLNTEQTAKILGVKPKTIAHWAARGRFLGAFKTSGRQGKWTIPIEAIKQTPKSGRPKLWEL